MAVRWYCSLPLSAAQVVRLLAERHIDVTARTVLNWMQTFAPQLAAALRTYRRRVGQKWTVDEVFCFRGRQKSTCIARWMNMDRLSMCSCAKNVIARVRKRFSVML